MAGTTLVLAVLAAAAGCASEARVDSRSSGVVDGTPTDGWPAVVSLGGCSGTLISPRVVLTAAHCVGSSASSVEAHFGSRDDDEGPWIQAVHLEVHDSVDLALFTLEEPGPTAPMAYARFVLDDSYVGQEVRLVGFGSTGEYEGGGGIKRTGTTTVDHFTTNSLYLDEVGAKTCYGDSGGPYFMTLDGVETLVAATKGATGICEEGLSFGTRVDKQTDWVTAYIAEHDPAKCTADQQCATGCAEPDPDCPCAGDGLCTAACADLASDPDCAGCGAGDTCRMDCPVLDSDCCAADGDCEAACGDSDPDCLPPDDPPNPDDPGDDDMDPPGGTLVGGCQAGQGGRDDPAGAWIALALGLLVTGRGIRRRRAGSAWSDRRPRSRSA